VVRNIRQGFGMRGFLEPTRNLPPSKPHYLTVNAVSDLRLEPPPPPPSEQLHPVALARRAGAGEEVAQRQLFRELRPRLHATLYRVLGSNIFIEDVLQDTFVEVFRSLASYRGEALMTTWADRIAIRVAYRFLRRHKAASAQEPAPPSLCLVGSAEDNLLHREGVRRLYAVLDRMKPQLRITFALVAVDGRSLKDVAEQTGVSLIAVKSRVWRARRLLEQAAREDTVLARYLSGEDE
jgi:RNA polymerase sigma-70 factor, ECF subfamily